MAIKSRGIASWSVLVLLASASSLPAQWSSPYPQPTAYGYYGHQRGYAPPVLRYPNGAYYNASRSMPMPQQAYNGNGVNYYYVQNPNGANTYPFTSPYGTPVPDRAPVRAPSWPAPAPVMEAVVDDGPNDGTVVRERAAPIPYHRETNERFWFKADYLASFHRPMRQSGPLATTGSVMDLVRGALGSPGTSVLPGSENRDFGLISGIRLEGGKFLDTCNRFSVEVAAFVNLPSEETFSIRGDANGNPLIARPIFNVVSGQEGSFLTSAPGLLTGSLLIEQRTEMQGIEFNARYHTYTHERLHLDALVGLRYVRLAEKLRLSQQVSPIQANFLTFLGQPVNVPNMLLDEDNFETVNHFIGPQVGGRMSWEYRWFTMDVFGKLALGATLQRTDINGSTTFVGPGGNQVATGGILAQQSNIGNHRRTIFGILPEFGTNFGVDVTECVRLKFGYSLLMWNHVARPGSQFDRNVNPSQVPGSTTFGTQTGPQAPAFRFNDEFFFSHTFNLGFEVHF